MRIAICEDEAIHSSLLERYIEQWVATQNFDVEIKVYESAEAFITDFDNKVAYDLAFLDIQMPGMDGMNLAQYIRQWDMSMIIVFITNFGDYSEQGYEVNAMRYLRKPVREKKVIETLMAARDLCRKRQTGYFVVNDDQGAIRIPKADIVYFRSEGHYILVHALNLGNRPTPRFRGKLKDMAGEFSSPSYTLANRGTLVNVQFIQCIIRDEIYLSTDEKLIANKPYLRNLNKSFLAIHIEPRLFSASIRNEGK